MHGVVVSTARPGRPAIAIACLLVVCGLITGCGRREASDGAVRLVMTTAGGVKERDIYNQAVSRFEAQHPNIHVRILPISKDYYRKVLVMIAGRDAPDLMWMGQSFGEFAGRGAFMDLSARIAEEVDLDDYFDQPVGWYNIDGKQLGIPFAIDTDFVVYNKALLDEAGVEYPTDDWTGEDLIRKAKALTLDRDRDGRTDQYGYRGNVDSSAFGAEIISADGKTPLCNSPEMIDYLQFTLDVVHKHRICPLPGDVEQEGLDTISLFRQGKAAMMRFYTWSLPELRDKCADLDWDIVMMPKFAQRAHWASSQAILVSSETPYPDEAWLLCKYFFSDEFQRIMAFRGLPPSRKVAEKIVAENDEAPENLAVLLKAADYLYPFPRVAHLQELMEHFWNAAESVDAQRATPQEALQRAEKAMWRTIERRQ